MARAKYEHGEKGIGFENLESRKNSHRNALSMLDGIKIPPPPKKLG